MLELPHIKKRKSQMSLETTECPPPSDGKTAVPSYIAAQSTPKVPSESGPSNTEKDPKLPVARRFSTAVGAIISILAMRLVLWLCFATSAHAAECVPQSTSLNTSSPIIAVMGATGTGKSSFIRDLQGRDSKGCLPKVGHGLQSCTKNVTWYSTSLTGQAFTILDTPGFDDIALSDSTILHNVATELASIYQEGRHLAGLIYLHDISKVKMGKTSYKNMQLFQKLVGSQSLKNVILVTTHWSSTENKDLHSREKELRTSFWKPMIKQGSQVFRHAGTVDSARAIASNLINKPPIVPQITDELVKQKLRFGDTEAFKLLNDDLKAYGADLKDEINIISNQLKDMTKQRAQDALAAKKEKEQLVKKLDSAFQEAAKREDASMELQALNKRLSIERSERLKDIQDLKKEKERYEKLLDDTAMHQKQLEQTLTIPTAFYPVDAIFEFLRFVGMFSWGAETFYKIIAFCFIMNQHQNDGGDALFISLLQWIFWVPFSYLFFHNGPTTLSVFIAVCHLGYRLLITSHFLGYISGVSDEKENSKARAAEQYRIGYNTGVRGARIA